MAEIGPSGEMPSNEKGVAWAEAQRWELEVARLGCGPGVSGDVAVDEVESTRAGSLKAYEELDKPQGRILGRSPRVQ